MFTPAQFSLPTWRWLMPGFPTVSPRSLDPMISMHAYAALSRSPVVPAPIDAPRELLEQLIGNRFISTASADGGTATPDERLSRLASPNTTCGMVIRLTIMWTLGRPLGKRQWGCAAMPDRQRSEKIGRVEP